MRRPHIDPWLAVAVALAAALVAVGAWVLVDRSSSSTTVGIASPEAATMLHDRLAALNGGDARAISAFYTRAAVLEERDFTPAVVTKGASRSASA